jgi:hypothetical protein
VSNSLNLILTLSDVRGIPYKLYNDPAPTIEEFIAYYGDRIQFEITRGDASAQAVGAVPLPINSPGAPQWELLKETAKATGAFPIFLAPRILKRPVSDYAVPL